MYRAVLGQGEEVPVTFGGGGWWMEGKWAWMKVKWALCEKDDLEEFRGHLFGIHWRLRVC
jgi:hypothetical protein